MPRQNPQLQWGGGGSGSSASANQTAAATSKWHQHALVATSHKLVKVRINSCKARPTNLHQHHHQQTGSGAPANSTTVDECLACGQLQDPFCGWCSSSAACTTRDECLTGGIQAATPIHWTPFDSIRCSNYQPISPKNLPLQVSDELVDVNVRLVSGNYARPTSARLAQASFSCHFDFLSHWNKSSASPDQPLPRPSGATTKATQARLNPHASTVAIGCPLPAPSQRPASLQGGDQLKVRLSVRLLSVQQADSNNQVSQDSEVRAQIERSLGMRMIGGAAAAEQQQSSDSIERELTLYDCSVHSSCQSCLSAGSQGRRWACAWCPLSQRCTFNASQADFGCAAQAVASTTPHSLGGASATPIRGSHLTASLDRAQAEVLSMSLDKLAQCPPLIRSDETGSVMTQPEVAQAAAEQAGGVREMVKAEILVPNSVRRAVQVPLVRPIGHYQRDKRVIKLECLIELEGTRARFPARLMDNTNVLCQETLFSYQSEISLQKASLSVILNENQVIEMTEVIIYKCHLFGVSPPALTSSVVATPPPGQPPVYSSVSWSSAGAASSSSSSDLLNFIQTSTATINQPIASQRRSSDCSLCSNVERKFQCSWCSNQCKFSEQCQELPASSCPPPRIDSIHPNVGPLEGGTLLTIEGSNLGSNEREIQDKILVGGEPCQLLMYSVSTRIVCKTGPSLAAIAATVSVGNRAGVTSALDKFHYKAVHLSDVSPRVGPVSGGTRLYLSGANLNIGSRIQVFLDDIPCPLDSNYEMSSNQIACITGPNLVVNSMRISKLTLQVDNSTHHLPYPFTYLPDPIIHSIEPAESFISGGRLLLITGQHLSSPQSIKLQVYHEFQPNISNLTTCMRQNDTCVTCLTPAFSRDLLALGAGQHAGEGVDQVLGNGGGDLAEANQVDTWNTNGGGGGGLKLKMALLMDDVRSARNLDEYYHHLPHHLSYFEDPRLFKLPNLVVEYRDELLLAGEHLQMRQLDQDMLITVGVHVCAIKSISGDRVTCQPPAQIAPVYNDRRQLVEQPLLQIVALIGSNLRYELGYMQYTSAQYRQQQQQQQSLDGSGSTRFDGPGDSWATNYNSLYGATTSLAPPQTQFNSSEQQATSASGWLTFLILSLLGLVIAFGLSSLLVAMFRFRSAKAEQREYKRIQLQMGSLDVGGAPGPPLLGGSGGLFDKIHLPTGSYLGGGGTSAQGGGFRFSTGTGSPPTLSLATGGSKTKPFYQFFTSASQQAQQQHQQPPPPQRLFPEVNTGSPAHHVLKLTSSGMIVSSSGSAGHYEQCGVGVAAPGSSSSTSPGGSSSSRHLLANNNQTNYNSRQHNNNNHNHNNWTQEAPSTIVPYAVIEACNLTLEGKNAIKREYV